MPLFGKILYSPFIIDLNNQIFIICDFKTKRLLNCYNYLKLVL